MASPPGGAALPQWAWRALRFAWVALAGLVIASLAAELVLRLERRRDSRRAADFQSRNIFTNPETMHAAHDSLWKRRWRKYRPGAELELTVSGERYHVQINSWGFRTREFSVPKPVGTFRVLCLGGSTTVAGRTNDETYPALLERELRQRHPGLALEVLNLGISGTTSDYWIERRDKLFGFEPDLVVEYRAINDVFWHHMKRYGELHPWRSRVHRSQLLTLAFPLDPASFDPLFQETLGHFGRMERECRQRGVRYIVGSFAGPDPETAAPAFLRYLDVSLDFWNRELPLYRYSQYWALLLRHNELLELFAHEQRLELVPVHRRLREAHLFLDVCHLTPEGIGRLAGEFLPAVSRVIESAPWRAASRSTSRDRPAVSKPS